MTPPSTRSSRGSAGSAGGSSWRPRLSDWPDTGPVPESARSYGDRDPALERLLPAGNRADDQVAAEYRRLTEDGLRRRKADGLETAIAALRRATATAVELDERTAVADGRRPHRRPPGHR